MSKKYLRQETIFLTVPLEKKDSVIILGFFSVGWLAFQESWILDPGILLEFWWNLGPKEVENVGKIVF